MFIMSEGNTRIASLDQVAMFGLEHFEVEEEWELRLWLEGDSTPVTFFKGKKDDVIPRWEMIQKAMVNRGGIIDLRSNKIICPPSQPAMPG